MSPRGAPPNARLHSLIVGLFLFGFLGVGLLGDTALPGPPLDLFRVRVEVGGIYFGGDRVVEVFCAPLRPCRDLPLPAASDCPAGYFLGIELFDKERWSRESLVIPPFKARLEEAFNAWKEHHYDKEAPGAIPEVRMRVYPALPFRFLKEILYTAGRVGHPRIGGLKRFLIGSNWLDLPASWVSVILSGTGYGRKGPEHDWLEILISSDKLRLRLRRHRPEPFIALDESGESLDEIPPDPERILSLMNQGEHPSGELSEVIAELLAVSENPWSSLLQIYAEDATPWSQIEQLSDELGVSRGSVQGCKWPYRGTRDGHFTCVLLGVY